MSQKVGLNRTCNFCFDKVQSIDEISISSVFQYLARKYLENLQNANTTDEQNKTKNLGKLRQSYSYKVIHKMKYLTLFLGAIKGGGRSILSQKIFTFLCFQDCISWIFPGGYVTY